MNWTDRQLKRLHSAVGKAIVMSIILQNVLLQQSEIALTCCSLVCQHACAVCMAAGASLLPECLCSALKCVLP